MKRWNSKKQENSENVKIDNYINEVIELSKKHGLSISHEDGHGGFVIEKYSESNAEWLMAASDDTDGS